MIKANPAEGTDAAWVFLMQFIQSSNPQNGTTTLQLVLARCFVGTPLVLGVLQRPHQCDEAFPVTAKQENRASRCCRECSDALNRRYQSHDRRSAGPRRKSLTTPLRQARHPLELLRTRRSRGCATPLLAQCKRYPLTNTAPKSHASTTTHGAQVRHRGSLPAHHDTRHHIEGVQYLDRHGGGKRRPVIAEYFFVLIEFAYPP
jgi:hypothetical protein